MKYYLKWMGLLIQLIVLAGCHGTTDSRNDRRGPTVISVPLIAEYTTFGGARPPSALAPVELERLLNMEMPAPRGIDGTVSLIAVIEITSGRKILWCRPADTNSFGDWQNTKYRDCFRDQSGPLTLRDGIGALLGEARHTSFNAPAEIAGFLFFNYVLVTKEHILIIALPVGRVYRPQGLFAPTSMEAN